MTEGGPDKMPTYPGLATPLVSASRRQLSSVLPPPFAFVEMSLLIAVILLEYFWDGFPALTRINPHPYWIGILLLSLQYGTVSGLLAAGIAIIGTVLIGMPEPDIEERYFNYLVRVWTQPVLWLLVALLLGAFRARQIEQRDELLDQAENLRIRGATLLDHANNLRARCTMLERRIALRETGDTSQLLAALARLKEASPGRWAVALQSALTAAFPHGRFSLYGFDAGRARLILSHDPSPDTEALPAAPEIPADHPLLSAVSLDGRAVSVLDAADDAALRGQGVAAVPIPAPGLIGAQSRIVGMLKADRLDPAQIDATLTRRLSVIAEHLGAAVEAGAVAPVATSTSVESRPAQRTLEAAIPTLRKWRLMKLLTGSRAGSTPSLDGSDA